MWECNVELWQTFLNSDKRLFLFFHGPSFIGWIPSSTLFCIFFFALWFPCGKSDCKLWTSRFSRVWKRGTNACHVTVQRPIFVYSDDQCRGCWRQNNIDIWQLSKPGMEWPKIHVWLCAVMWHPVGQGRRFSWLYRLNSLWGRSLGESSRNPYSFFGFQTLQMSVFFVFQYSHFHL